MSNRSGSNHFDREAIPGLPPLAWLFESTAAGKGRLLHGSAVCVHDEGFIEGCPAQKRMRILGRWRIFSARA